MVQNELPNCPAVMMRTVETTSIAFWEIFGTPLAMPGGALAHTIAKSNVRWGPFYTSHKVPIFNLFGTVHRILILASTLHQLAVTYDKAVDLITA